jgi:hypothetical protein
VLFHNFLQQVCGALLVAAVLEADRIGWFIPVLAFAIALSFLATRPEEW